MTSSTNATTCMRSATYPIEEYAVVAPSTVTQLGAGAAMSVELPPVEVSAALQRGRTARDSTVTHDGKVYELKEDGKHTVASVAQPMETATVVQLTHNWEYEHDDDDWRLFQWQAAFLAEYAAVHGTPTVAFRVGGHAYALDIDASTQKNVTTQKVRKVRKSQDLLTTGVEHIPPQDLPALMTSLFGFDMSSKFNYNHQRSYPPRHQRGAVRGCSYAHWHGALDDGVDRSADKKYFCPVGFSKVAVKADWCDTQEVFSCDERATHVLPRHQVQAHQRHPTQRAKRLFRRHVRLR